MVIKRDNIEPMTYSAIAFDDVPETAVLHVAANSFNGTTITGARYKITSLPAGSGGGEGVPEFSTYVYLMTLLVGFGMIHRKSQEKGSVLA